MPDPSSIQKNSIDLLAKSPLKEQFYWTGDTLLSSFYLHHRQSKDLDFFSDSKFSYHQIINFIKELKKN